MSPVLLRELDVIALRRLVAPEQEENQFSAALAEVVR
jgi:hypothetical protein